MSPATTLDCTLMVVSAELERQPSSPPALEIATRNGATQFPVVSMPTLHKRDKPIAETSRTDHSRPQFNHSYHRPDPICLFTPEIGLSMFFCL